MSIHAYLGVLICFASLIPFLCLGIYGIPPYTDVRKLEVLTTICQGRRFLQGLEIAGIIVCTFSTTPQEAHYNTYSFGSRVLLALFGIYLSFTRGRKLLDYDSWSSQSEILP